MNEVKTRTEIDAAVEASKKFLQPEILEIHLPAMADPILGDALPLLTMPEGRKLALADILQAIEPYRERPRHPHAKGSVTLHDLASFITYCQDFRADTGSDRSAAGRLVIYGCDNPIGLKAILDHDEDAGLPAFGRHTATFSPKETDAWKAWNNVDGQELEQAQLAQFLEDHIGEVANITDDSGPDAVGWKAQQERQFGARLAGPSELLAVAGHLEVTVGRRVTNKPSLATGEVTFEFSEEHETATAGGTKVAVPKLFALSIAPHVNSPPYLVLARLRYRVVSGSVKWRIMLHRLDLVRQVMFRSACDEVEKELNIRPLLGSRAT